MKILWLTWKDKSHPHAGGAEVVAHELAKRLVKDGHEVIFIVGGHKNSNQEEIRDGYNIVRLGNRYTVYHKARVYYQKHLRGWADFVIDEVNTIPFFAKFYVQERNILFIHQLCRMIWFYQMRIPFSLVGYLLEPLYLRMINDRRVITVSESTKKDLMRHGFKPENISIISEGIELEPVENLDAIQKYDRPTLLSLGSVRPMKRTLDQVKAFELAKKKIPSLCMKIAGDISGSYGEMVREYINQSQFADDIEVLGRVDREEKIGLMQKCHFIVVTSIKEGWGLIVTEAASQGTPAVVYDVDGLRDSVQKNKTGWISSTNTPDSLADIIVEGNRDPKTYSVYRKNGWEDSRCVNFLRSYGDFKEVLYWQQK